MTLAPVSPLLGEDRFYEQLGRRLRDARERKGWSQGRLAFELGTENHVQVSYWESGLRRLRAFELYQLDRLFGEGWR